jgi:adenosylcobinamide-GDP ribazoletransferase
MESAAFLRLALADAAACIAFYTRLPLPPAQATPAGRSFAAAQWAAPLAGVVVGLAGGLVLLVSVGIGLPATVCAVLALGATMLLTGCLHEDGLADLADGLGGGKTREEKLAIMKDSRIGTYGVAALATALLLRFAALAALASPGSAVAALVAAHAAARALIPSFMVLVPPARTNGLSAGVGPVPQNTAGGALVIGAAALLFLGLSAAIAAVVLLAGWFFALKFLSERQIGGQTGDVLGALEQGGEIAVLLAASIFLS